MKADPAAQLRLIEVQSVDTALAQLEHRAQTLPQHALLKAHAAKRATLGQDLVAAETVLSDATSAQEKAEADLVPVRQRLERDQQRVDSGSITDPKVLRNIVDEIEHLKGRIVTLEDAELDLMQALEDAQADRDRIATRRAEVEATMRSLMAERDAAAADLSKQATERRGARAELVKDIPGPLLELYDRIRARLGGTGASALSGRRCTGCGLEATPTAYDRYLATPPDEVVRCEECDRILVRS